MNVRSLNKKFLALSVITFALLMQTSCGPEKPIRKVYLSKETYFKELNETLNDHHFLTPIKENDFHVVGNTNSIYDADVVVFAGDIHEREKGLDWMLALGLSIPLI